MWISSKKNSWTFLVVSIGILKHLQRDQIDCLSTLPTLEVLLEVLIIIGSINQCWKCPFEVLWYQIDTSSILEELI
jgi:hypothetical protein